MGSSAIASCTITNVSPQTAAIPISATSATAAERVLARARPRRRVVLAHAAAAELAHAAAAKRRFPSGHIRRSGHSAQRGERATQVRRPWRISSTCVS